MIPRGRNLPEILEGAINPSLGFPALLMFAHDHLKLSFD
jgi:hypothetical protein